MATGTSPDLVPTADEFFESERQARIAFARRAAKRKDILGWGEALFPEKFNLPYCHELHDYFVDIRGEEFTSTEAPRYHSKTTIKCFLIPIFQAVEEPETFRHYLNVQATDDKALEVNRAIKVELESNDLLREMYGDQVGDSRWTDQRFVLANGVIFSAVGAGRSIRGINYRNIRPDYIIVDDLYDEDDIYSPTSAQKKGKWFWSSLYPARAKARKTSIHLQGTAINSDDLLEECKKKAGIKSATFKAVKSWEKGIVLWPELNTLKSLQIDQIRMGPIIFAREMQNERLDETTTILKRSYWRTYAELPSGFDIVVTSWDMTFKETKAGSFVVGQAWGRRNADFYLFPIMIRGRMDFIEALASVQNLAATYPYAVGHLVEDKANGPAVISSLTKKIPGLIAIGPHGSKVARAVAITPPLAAGNVYIPDPSLCPLDPETGAPWIIGFVEECARFRGHDNEVNDQVDTASQGIFYLMQTRYPEDDEDEPVEFIDGAESAGGFSE